MVQRLTPLPTLPFKGGGLDFAGENSPPPLRGRVGEGG
jgi:hypothetical protein